MCVDRLMDGAKRLLDYSAGDNKSGNRGPPHEADLFCSDYEHVGPKGNAVNLFSGARHPACKVNSLSVLRT